MLISQDPQQLLKKLPQGFKNDVINGNFDIWQRGEDFFDYNVVSPRQYVADQWCVESSGSLITNVGRDLFSINNNNYNNLDDDAIRIGFTSGSGTGDFVALTHRIEDMRSFNGGTKTISFWARGDIGKSISVDFQLYNLDNQATTVVGGNKFILSNVWQKFTATVSFPNFSDIYYIILTFWLDAGSNFNTRTNSLGHQAGTVRIAQVQVESGKIVTPFERRPIGIELMLCQRYFEKSYSLRKNPGDYDPENETSYVSAALNTAIVKANFQTPKRTRPTLTVYDSQGNAGKISAVINGVPSHNITPTFGSLNEKGFTVSHSTANLQRIYFHWTASAEL